MAPPPQAPDLLASDAQAGPASPGLGAVNPGPINLGLNDGTYAPQACIDALARFRSRTSLRAYTSSDNAPLREAIARADGVGSQHVFLQNGSGPILKQAIPHLIKRAIMASPLRIAKHLLRKDGFPIITPKWTYSKVPAKGAELGLTLRVLPLSEDDGFRLDRNDLERALEQGDGLVYVVNPNNPTGNVLLHKRDLIPLLQRYPRARFWIDEAYCHYLDETEYPRVSELVPRYSNLVVSRTFSFAYGLAGLRVGYLLAAPNIVAELEKQLTDYRIGVLAETLCIAALEDTEHLPFVRQATRKAVAFLREGIDGAGAAGGDKNGGDKNRTAGIEGLRSFPSQANFVLVKSTAGVPAKAIAQAMAAEGVLVKTFSPFAGHRFDEWLRITVGIPEENERALAALRVAMDKTRGAAKAAR